MKIKVLALLSLFSVCLGSAQVITEIESTPVELRKATDGTLDLYYGLFQRQYYFYVQTEAGVLVALEEHPESSNFFKTKLSQLTSGYGIPDSLDYELKSIQNYINAYNQSIDPNYKAYKLPAKIAWHATIFGGMTNNPFVSNDDNVLNPFLQLEFEFSENIIAPRHTGFFQVRYSFPSDKFDYQSTELSLGYRFRFLRKERFNVFAQVRAVSFNSSEVTLVQELSEVTIERSAFDAPFVFGVGADFKLGKKSYITFIYSELFAIFTENQGNFPLDFAIGYKLKL